MHYINYLLVAGLIFIIYKVITEKRAKAARAQRIEFCRVCGAPGQLEEDYFDSHVRCTNQSCAMAGPKGHSEAEAISNWNNIPSMGTVVAWQFQAAGLALALQRLVDSGQSLSNAQYLAARISSFGPAAKEVGEEFDTALADARNSLEARHG